MQNNRPAGKSLFSGLLTFLLFMFIPLSLHAVSLQLDGTRTLVSGTDCQSGAVYRFGTSTTYNGKQIDLYVEVENADNDYSEGECVFVKDGTLATRLRDTDADENEAHESYKITLVEQGTTTPVKVDRLMITAFDLDTNYNRDIDTDDVYIDAPDGTYISDNSRVNYAEGNYNGNYNVRMIGWDGGNCDDTQSNPDPTCRASSIWVNGSAENEVSQIRVRVQNDNAYGDRPTDSENIGLNRLIQLSFQIEDFSALFTGQKEYGDAPASYGGAGARLDGTVILGNGLPADTESSYHASNDAAWDDTHNENDENAVKVNDNTLQGQSFANGANVTLQITTYGSGYLNGWFDWNRDGDFDDAGEHIISDKAITNNGESGTSASSGITQTTRTVTVPANAKNGKVFARFRYSAVSNLSASADSDEKGEVEDYAVTITGAGTISGKVTTPDGSGIAGVTIFLTDNTDAALKDIDGNDITVQTDTDGTYHFSDVPTGTVVIHETNPAGYSSVSDTEGANDDKITLSVAADSSYNDNDFVDTLPTGTISGTVTDDQNNPLSGAVVTLWESDGTTPAKDNTGNALSPVTTDASGTFSFANITIGEYILKEQNPSGYISTGDTAGDDETQNSSQTDDTIPVQTTAAAADDTDNKFIDQLARGKVGGMVEDFNGNPLAGAVIRLLNSDYTRAQDVYGNMVADINTTANGTFLFENLAAGDYFLLELDPAGYFSVNDTAGDDEQPSNVDDDNKINVHLVTGEMDEDNVFTDRSLSQISGFVFADTTGDTNGDTPIPGVTITLNSCQTGGYHASAVTEADGSYHFTELQPGCYLITETDKDGYISLHDMDTDNDNNITVTLGENSLENQNFTDQPSLQISGTVWGDMNFDNTVDKGLEGVTITLLDSNGVLLQNIKTASDGTYRFSGIAPGHYTIKETDPAGFVSIADSDGENDNLISVTLVQTDVIHQDFKDQKRVTVSGTIKVDTDGDKVVDTILPGAELVLLDENGNIIQTTTTDSNGGYSFSGLRPGESYTIEIKDKPGYEPLGDADGINDQKISIDIPLNDLGDITGQDFEEMATAPQYILLTKSAGKKETHIGAFVPYTITVENIDDTYTYANLNVEDTLPAGFKYEKGSARIHYANSTQKLQATGDKSVLFGAFVLKPHQSATITYLLKVSVSVAAGRHTNTAVAIQNGKVVSNRGSADVLVTADTFADNAVVIGKVFEDANANGIQDQGEKGIPGVRIATATGMLIETDAFGRYHLADVESGGFGGRGKNIILKVDPATLPEGARFTTENPRVYRITAGQLNTIDFGVQLPKQKAFSREVERVKTKTVTVPQPVTRQVKLGSIYFDSDQSCIRPDQVKSLRKIAQKLHELDGGKIVIEGNTDARAPVWYNKKLAYKRAQSVYRELKHCLGDAQIGKVEVTYFDCDREVKFDPKYDWWGKPNIPRTKKECTRFGLTKKECAKALKRKEGGAS